MAGLVRLFVAAGIALLFILGAGSFLLSKGPITIAYRTTAPENPVQGPAIGEVKNGSARLAAAPKHPLDPLTYKELEIVRQVLVDEGFVTPGAHNIHGVELREPPKSAVLLWERGNALPVREAYVNTYRDGKIHEIVVDINAKKVVLDEVYSGSGKPMFSSTDFAVVEAVPLKDPRFQEAAAKRGVPLDRIYCIPFSGGWYNQTQDGNRRLARAACFDTRAVNFYMLPIEGVTIWVDLDTEEVFGFFDEGLTPFGDATRTRYTAKEFSNELDPPLKPISIEQPQGVNFKADGHSFSWLNWNLHIRPDPRAGLKISRVTFKDPETNTERDVMYQGYLAEMFVPYQDPSQSWFFRTFMDAGEYGFGLLSRGLVPLNDCPRNAHYLDGVFAGPDGEPIVTPNMVCIFERYAGDVLWRHTEMLHPAEGVVEVRPKVSLVVRQTSAVGNYDYTIDWEFQLDGLIRTSVTMSGMVTVKSVMASTMNEVANGEELHGSMVNDHTVAVAHDHFFSFRLDMDVDGPENSFQEAQLVTRRLAEGSSWRKSIWDVKKNVPKTERDAQYNVSSSKPAEYFVFNPSSKTRLGNQRSYKLVPRTTGVALNTDDDFPQHRAAWSKNAIWVTPYEPRELWPGGTFPNQCQGEDTLATWTEKDRPVENTDIVLWHTVAYHHFPVQEDFPVMPSTMGGFELKPANFFEANPAIRQRAFTEAQMPTCAVNALTL